MERLWLRSLEDDLKVGCELELQCRRWDAANPGSHTHVPRTPLLRALTQRRSLHGSTVGGRPKTPARPEALNGSSPNDSSTG